MKRALRGLRALRAWVRRQPPAPAPEPSAPLPAKPRELGRLGPYRDGAEREEADLAPDSRSSWPGPLARFEGYEVLHTDRGPPGYARQLIMPPGRPGERLSLACFDARTVDDDPYFALAFDETRIHALLRHPRLARLLGLGRDGGIYWHLAAYPPGITLTRVLRARRQGERLPLLP